MIELRRFTDLQTMRDNKGEILQAIAHVLKLMYGYNYQKDRLNHLKDIIGWCDKVASTMKSDPHSHEISLIDRYFDREFPFSKNKQKLQTIIKRYDPSKIISKKEYMYADILAFECINILRKYDRIDAYDYLSSKFPKSGFDEWDVVGNIDESLV